MVNSGNIGKATLYTALLTTLVVLGFMIGLSTSFDYLGYVKHDIISLISGNQFEPKSICVQVRCFR